MPTSKKRVTTRPSKEQMKKAPATKIVKTKDLKVNAFRTGDVVDGTGIQAIFGVSAPVIARWRAQGMPYIETDSFPFYDPAACVSWRRERERLAEVRQVAGGASVNEFKNVKAKADAERQQLVVRQMRGELVSTPVLRDAVEKVIGDFAAVAKGQLHQFERDIAQCRTAGEARKIMENITDELMRGAQAYRKTIEPMLNIPYEEPDNPNDEEEFEDE